MTITSIPRKHSRIFSKIVIPKLLYGGRMGGGQGGLLPEEPVKK